MTCLPFPYKPFGGHTRGEGHTYLCRVSKIVLWLFIVCFILFITGLIKETCLIPLEENEKLPEDDTYSFITECFYLCHQAINQGFHCVSEKFIKLNQELHRIQQAYQAIQSHGVSMDNPRLSGIKQQMETGIHLLRLILHVFNTEKSLV